MAEYHFHGQIIKRSEGRSAIACAAYRAAAPLFDEQLGLTMSFPTKPCVVHSEIMLPEGAPVWMRDRERLWNAVEQAEHRRDAQLAYDYDVAIPVELSPEGRLELVRSFVRDQFVNRGRVADFAIHHEKDDNPHFHVMVAMRDIEGGGFARSKPRAWNGRFAQLERLREAWAHAANLALANEGHRVRIDHRSYATRGIDLEPQPKLFRRAREAHQDRRDHVADRTRFLLSAMARNGERIIARPEIALQALTSKQATFDEDELLRFIDRHTANAEQFARALAVVRASPEIVVLQDAAQGEVVYTTRSIVALERRLLADCHVLANRAPHLISEALIEQALALAAVPLTSEQEQAVRHLAQSGDLAIVSGYAGSGKSTMLAVARTAWEAQGLRVRGGALAGKAAEGLADESAAGIPARTLHAWQWAWQQDRERLSSRDVFVVDEAAMVGTEQLAAVVDEVRRAGAKLVLVGDARQLRSIAQGAPMRLLQERYEPARLTKVVRQRSHAWQRDATMAFAAGDATRALRAYLENGRVQRAADELEASRLLVATWARDRLQSPGETSLILAFRRKDVQLLNELARTVRREAGELGEDQLVCTTQGERQFAVGDRVFFLKNDKMLGVTNGSLGTVEEIWGADLTVRLDTHRRVTIDSRTYCALDHGYAGTIHKSQGATVDRTYVLASRYMDDAASYVALSRHRSDAALFYGAREFASSEQLVDTLARTRSNHMAHDFLREEREVQRFAEKIERDELFLAIRPADQDAELAVLQQIGAGRARSAAELMTSLGEVRLATADVGEAERDLASALRALDDYEREHPHRSRLGLGIHRKKVDEVERARAQYAAAVTRLDKVRLDPNVRQRAEQLATNANIQIKRAQVRWRELVAVRQARARGEALAGHVREENLAGGSLAMRSFVPADQDRALEFVRSVRIGGRTVSIFRDPSGGPLIIADADSQASAQPRLNSAPNRPERSTHERGD